jgi:hypothetical protein
MLTRNLRPETWFFCPRLLEDGPFKVAEHRRGRPRRRRHHGSHASDRATRGSAADGREAEAAKEAQRRGGERY